MATIPPIITPLDITFFGILDDPNAFVLVMIMLSGVLGLFSRKFSFAVYSSFMIFLYVAVDSDLWIYKSLLYVIMTLIALVGAARIYQYSGGFGAEPGAPEQAEVE